MARFGFSLLVLLVLLSLGSCISGDEKFEFEAEEIAATIRSHLAELRGTPKPNCQSVCECGYPCCNLTSSNCALSSFPQNQWQLVVPGGETGCIFGEQGSGPFTFSVDRGSPDKLLFYFMGGGACWDKWSTDQGLCATTCTEFLTADVDGVFDKQNPKNGYKDWTIVTALYCSGDLFVGNVSRPYTEKTNGYPIKQLGLANTLSVVQWLLQQQENGGLSKTLTEFTVMGCSAGAIAAQAWSPFLFDHFPSTKAAVISDSYAGVFPPDVIPPLINKYGACDAPCFTPSEQNRCKQNRLTIEEINEKAYAAYPDVPHTYIQAKTDDVQRSFYSAVALTSGKNPIITAAGYYQKVTDLFAQYNKASNWLTYLIDGNDHCFTPFSSYYTTSPVSASMTTSEDQSEHPFLVDWVNQLPPANGKSVDSVCVGPASSESDKTTFCSPSIVPKKFPQS